MVSTLLLDLPHLAYVEALGLMRGLVEKKHRVPFPEVLILLEHEPVLTMGRRAQSSDILVSEEVLAREGIMVHKVERGGSLPITVPASWWPTLFSISGPWE